MGPEAARAVKVRARVAAARATAAAAMVREAAATEVVAMAEGCRRKERCACTRRHARSTSAQDRQCQALYRTKDGTAQSRIAV